MKAELLAGPLDGLVIGDAGGSDFILHDDPPREDDPVWQRRTERYRRWRKRLDDTAVLYVRDDRFEKVTA